LTGVIVAVLLSASSAMAGGCTTPLLDAAACRSLAEQGDAIAQFDLGFLYEQGKGVPQDYAEAVKWYWKSAEQGYYIAQTMLGEASGLSPRTPRR
jgi:TPR repeat protein